MFKKTTMVFLMILAMFLVGNMEVNAGAKDDLYDKLIKTYKMNNGIEYGLTESQKVEVERYFNSNSITDDDADYISNKVDDAIALLNKSNVSSFDKLSKNDKNVLKGLITDISRNTPVNVELNGDKTISVYNLDGTLFAVEGTEVIKYTGNNDILYMSIFGILSIACISVICKNKFSKEV